MSAIVPLLNIDFGPRTMESPKLYVALMKSKTIGIELSFLCSVEFRQKKRRKRWKSSPTEVREVSLDTFHKMCM